VRALRKLAQALALPTVSLNRDVVVEMIRKLAAETPLGGLVYVPTLVCRLDGSPSAILPMLLALERQGVVELRPDSRVGAMPAGEDGLYPKGINGVPLSMIRERPPATSQPVTPVGPTAVDAFKWDPYPKNPSRISGTMSRGPLVAGIGPTDNNTTWTWWVHIASGGNKASKRSRRIAGGTCVSKEQAAVAALRVVEARLEPLTRVSGPGPTRTKKRNP
jgi:hypothetical protein